GRQGRHGRRREVAQGRGRLHRDPVERHSDPGHAAELRRTQDQRNRSRRARRHLGRRRQAGDARDRRGGARAAVREPGRNDQGRHAVWRIRQPGQVMAEQAVAPEACDLLVEAGHVVPVEPHGVVLEDHAVAIRGGEIVAILPRAEARARFAPAEVVSRPDGVLVPGFVNAHTHNPMTLMRRIADDLPLKVWLQQHIWPIEAAVMAPDFVADGITLAIAEMLRGGTTCCNENYFFPDVQAAVYKRHGFRARVGLPVIDFPTAWASGDDEYFDKAGVVHDQWRNDPLIAMAFAPHAPYTVNDANFERVRM